MKSKTEYLTFNVPDRRGFVNITDKVDGIVYHDAKTCPNNSNSRYEMPQRLQQEIGIPYLIINGDLNDLRLFSEEQTRTNLEAFAEQLLQV